jgi:putative oxidoreductase
VTTIELVGRLLFALVFLVSPGGVLRQVRTVVGAPPLRWMPRQVAIVTVSASCVVAVAGALLVALGLWPDLGALLIFAFLIPVTVTMHRFWEVEDRGQRAIKRGNFLLNTSLAGGALLYFCLVNQTQDVPAGLLSDPLLHRL